MKDTMKTQKRLWIALIAFGLFAIIFCRWVYVKDTVRENLSFNETVHLETSQAFENEIKTERMILPDEFRDQQSLLFKTTHTRVEIFLDGKEIYQYGEDKNAPEFMKSPGSCWHIVDIPKNSSGKTLELRILPTYPGYYGNELTISYGTRGECVLRILKDSFGTLLISCGILFAGMISLILFLSCMRTKNKMKFEVRNEILLNLGIFSLLIAIWSLDQCGFMQFLVPDGRTLYYIDFFSFLLFPIPFTFLIHDICKSKYRKGVMCLSILFMVNIALEVILQCAGIIDIFQLLSVTHILMMFLVIYTFIIIHYEAVKLENRAAREFKYPVYIIMTFGVMEMLMYYIRDFKKTSIFLPLGTLIFIISLIWIQVYRFYDQYVRKQKLVYLQKMANMDMLTEAMNRNAYENMSKYLDEQEIELKTTGVVLLDVDDLKVINDTYGHEKGDEALKLCYQCIRQAFKNEKNCFRIGGDEFAYVYHSEEKDQIPSCISILDRSLKEKTRDFVYPLSISSGYAYYIPDTDIPYVLSSSNNFTDPSSIQIGWDFEEYCPQQNGINFVIWDTATQTVINQASFNTGAYGPTGKLTTQKPGFLDKQETITLSNLSGVADGYSIVGIIYDDTDSTYKKQSIMTYDDETDTYTLDITGSKDELKNKSVRVYARYTDFTYRYIGSVHLQ